MRDAIGAGSWSVQGPILAAEALCVCWDGLGKEQRARAGVRPLTSRQHDPPPRAASCAPKHVFANWPNGDFVW